MKKIFKRSFVRTNIQPSGGQPFEIPADWLTWGDFVDLQVGAGLGGSGNKWTAWFQLVAFDGDVSSRHLEIDKGRARPTRWFV